MKDNSTGLAKGPLELIIIVKEQAKCIQVYTFGLFNSFLILK